MQPADVQAGLVAWLSKPESYPHRPQRVDHVQTHISHVFLAGNLVYKLKKPLRYDFLDYSTVAARESACREELRLNRRLAPDAYLEVVSLVGTKAGEYAWSGEGEICDWVVVMRRLPTELALDAVHRRGQLRPEQIDCLAQTLVRFYRELPPLAIKPHEYRSIVRAHVEANRRELMAASHHLPGEMVARVHGFQLQLLQLAEELFDGRVRCGRIIDGHGDLRPEHIVLADPIAIFDCIEFSPEFRRIDVADELAFLAAECDDLGAGWVGPQLLRSYQQASGDQVPPVLWDFYKAYRACVRAKVAALRADQLAGEAQSSAAEEARRRLAWADRYARPWLQPFVVLVGGLSGTGKTTLAAALAEALGAELLRTDVIRQETFGRPPQVAKVAAGIYSPESRQRVYDALFDRASNLLKAGRSVVLDGTFSSLATIRCGEELARELALRRFLAIECTCRPELAQERIGRRLADGRDASEARPELHSFQRERWEPWPPSIPQVRIDTELALSQQLESVLSALRRDTSN